MNRSPGSAAGFETEEVSRQGNQTLTRHRLEAFVAQVESGQGLRLKDYVQEEPTAVLVLEEVIDRTLLLRFLRHELNYQLNEAYGLLKTLPEPIFGLSDPDSGPEWIQRFADAGGRCSVRYE